MSDTSTTTAPKRAAVAVRDWIDSQGNPVESGKESTATGLRYIHLPTAKRLVPTFNPETDTAPADAVFELATMDPVTMQMCAIFGALTLAGNIVNTTVNGPKGDPNANPMPDVAARFAEIAKGEWSDRSTGVGGVRYDREKLAAAIAQAKGESDPAPYLAKMDGKVDAKSGAAVAQDAKGSISYGAYALRNAKVKAAYDSLTGGGTAIESL